MTTTMKRSHRIATAAAALLLVAGLGLPGCAAATSSSSSGASNTTATATSSSSSKLVSKAAGMAQIYSGKDLLDVSQMDFEYSKKDQDASYDASSATTITLSGSSATASSNTGVKIDGSTVTITAEGTYVLSGTLTDGQIVVEATDADKVQLVLNGVTITNNDGPAIYVKQADKVFITLAANSKNVLEDGSTYTLEAGEDEPDAVIFSKDDLAINGTGSLSITANCLSIS